MNKSNLLQIVLLEWGHWLIQEIFVRYNVLCLLIRLHIWIIIFVPRDRCWGWLQEWPFQFICSEFQTFSGFWLVEQFPRWLDWSDSVHQIIMRFTRPMYLKYTPRLISTLPGNWLFEQFSCICREAKFGKWSNYEAPPPHAWLTLRHATPNSHISLASDFSISFCVSAYILLIELISLFG